MAGEYIAYTGKRSTNKEEKVRSQDVANLHADGETNRRAEADLVFQHIMIQNPITKEEFAKLMAKRPELWSRYRKWFE